MFRKVKEAISHQVRNILESQSAISKQRKLMEESGMFIVLSYVNE